MFLLNHAVTGFVLAEGIDNQWMLYPVALGSHFVLDALPHFGLGEDFTSKKLVRIGVVDTVVTIVGGLTYVSIFPEKALPAAIAATLSALPDFGWLLKFKGWAKDNRFFRFHKMIQWGERKYGWIYEAVWTTFMVVLLLHFL